MTVKNRFANGDSPDPSVAAPEYAADPPAASTADQDARGSASDSAADSKGPAAFERLFDELKELRDYLGLLWAARLDRARLSARRLVLAVALGLLGLVVAATFLITSTVLVILGIGAGLGSLFGDRLWLGHLLTGLGLLGILAIGVYLAIRRMTRASHERTVREYARRRDQRAARTGHSPNDRPTDDTPGGQHVGI